MLLLFIALCASALVAQTTALTDGLYGLSAQVNLEEIDVNTGAIKSSFPALLDLAQAQQLSAMDSSKGLYYMIGYNDTTGETALFEQDVSNGRVVSVTTLPVVQSVFVGVGMTLEIDQTTKDIYITGMMSGSTPNEYSLIRVAQSDKKITVVKKNMINDIAVLGGFSCLDWAKGHLYIEYGVNTTGTVTIQVARLDVQTGALIGYFTNPLDLSSCSWDVSKGHFVGYGLKVESDGSYLRSVVSFNPSGQPPHMATMGTLPSEYTIMSGDCASVHDTTHELAGIFSADSSTATDRARRVAARSHVHNFGGQAVLIKPGKVHRVHSRAEKRVVAIDELGRLDASASSPPFHLVQNTHSGAVKTAPELCATSTECPWSIEWLNAKKDARTQAGVVVQK